MFELKDVLLTIAVILVILWLLFPFIETFDKTGTEFVSIGCPRYGLRGEELRRSSINKYFIRPDRQIRLSESGDIMWESNNPPASEGIRNCRTTSCPHMNGFDQEDTCWKCGTSPQKMIIPDIHPHVPN